jgi:hypothetical protein
MLRAAMLLGVTSSLLLVAAEAGSDRKPYIVRMDASAMPAPFVEHDG